MADNQCFINARLFMRVDGNIHRFICCRVPLGLEGLRYNDSKQYSLSGVTDTDASSDQLGTEVRVAGCVREK